MNEKVCPLTGKPCDNKKDFSVTTVEAGQCQKFNLCSNCANKYYHDLTNVATPTTTAFLKSMVDLLKDYKTRFIKVKRSYQNPIPKLYVINYAEPNFKKVSPSFITNGALGVLFSLLITSILLFIKQHRASF